MAKVFVSYSRKDIEFAKRLTGELQKSDLDFWIDWEGIPPTVDWWREIEKGIEEADVFLFLISPDSAKSKICGQEIETAVKNGKRLIPLVVRDIKGDETPAQLSHLNWIFFRENDDFDAALKKLLTSIHTDYEWVQEHRWLQVRALDWQRENKDNGSLLRGKDLQDAELLLARNTSKEPHPTDLQREYVFESRKSTDRQRRLTMGASIAAAIALAALAVIGFVQARLAREAQADALNKAAISQALQLGLQSPNLLNAGKSIQALKLKHIAENALNDAHNSQLSLKLLNSPSYSTLAASEDGRYVATAIMDQIVVWDAQNLSADPKILPGDTSVTTPIVFTDSNTLVSAEFDSEIVFWNVEKQTPIIRRLPVEDSTIIRLSFNPNGNLLVAGSGLGNVFVIDMNDPDNPSFGPYFPTVMNLNSIAISPDGKWVATGNDFGAVLIWDTAGFSFTPLKLPGNPDDFVNYRIADLNFSPDQKKFVVIRARDILIYDSKNDFGGDPHLLFLNDPDQSNFTDMKFSPEGAQLAVGSDDGTIRIWDMNKLDSSPRVIKGVDDFSKIEWLR